MSPPKTTKAANALVGQGRGSQQLFRVVERSPPVDEPRGYGRRRFGRRAWHFSSYGCKRPQIPFSRSVVTTEIRDKDQGKMW
jgi:hypothetical protein